MVEGKHDPDEYQQVVNDLKSCCAKQKQNTITFWAKAASKRRCTLDAQSSAAREIIQKSLILKIQMKSLIQICI